MSQRSGLVSQPSSVATQAKIIVLVTGGNAGIGYEIVKGISKLPNHQVLMGCRDTHKGETAAASMGAPINVNPIQLDVTDDESIQHAYLTIAQMFGKLDVLIHNAGSGGQDLPEGASERERADLIYSVNVTSVTLLTNKLTPVLEKSKLAKVIFVSSGGGSIQLVVDRPDVPPPLFTYGSSKAALNYLMALYSRTFPKWKVNAVCPGVRRTNLNKVEEREDTHPSLGAVRILELVQEGPEGVTGTFSNAEGSLPF